MKLRIPTMYYLRRFIFLVAFVVISQTLDADIAPNPIVAKSIFTTTPCMIQMVSEVVNVKLDYDSSKVECVFEMFNHGDSVTIDVGFPEMHFQYWSLSNYTPYDKARFAISVDGVVLGMSSLKAPPELDSVYQYYLNSHFVREEYQRKSDSVYKANKVIRKKDGFKYPTAEHYLRASAAQDSLSKWLKNSIGNGKNMNMEMFKQMHRGVPWYIWKAHFNKGGRKTIRVSYNMPAGIKGKGSTRYFKYLLNTGSGWYKEIENAKIILDACNLKHKWIESTIPKGYIWDQHACTMNWTFDNIEPTEADDIYIEYTTRRDARKWERYQRDKSR